MRRVPEAKCSGSRLQKPARALVRRRLRSRIRNWDRMPAAGLEALGEVRRPGDDDVEELGAVAHGYADAYQRIVVAGTRVDGCWSGWQLDLRHLGDSVHERNRRHGCHEATAPLLHMAQLGRQLGFEVPRQQQDKVGLVLKQGVGRDDRQVAAWHVPALLGRRGIADERDQVGLEPGEVQQRIAFFYPYF